MPHRLTALGLVFALLAGCATPPAPRGDRALSAARPALPAQYGATTTPPETRATAPTAETLAAWWRQFDDPLLGELVTQALQANTDLRAAQARLAQARALRDVAAAGLRPQLGTSASVARNRANGQTRNAVAAGLDASWELDASGARADTLTASQADAEQAAANLAATQVSLSGEVGLAYVQWRGLGLQRRIAQDNLATQRDTEQLTAWRAQAGLASTLDAEQARAAAEQTAARLPAFDASLQQTENRLAVLLGQAPGALHDRLTAASTGAGDPGSNTGAIPNVPALDLTTGPAVGLPAELLRRRPDVVAAEQSIRAEAARLSASEAARRPSFSISGNLGWQAATLSALSGPGALAAGIGAIVNWTALDGGAGAARVAAQQAALQQAQASYQGAVLLAVEDVANALAGLHASAGQLASLQRASVAAHNALLLAQYRYSAGLIDFTTLLDAQRSALTLDDSVAQVRIAQSQSLITLYKSLGGGWDAAGSPASAPVPTSGPTP